MNMINGSWGGTFLLSLSGLCFSTNPADDTSRPTTCHVSWRRQPISQHQECSKERLEAIPETSPQHVPGTPEPELPILGGARGIAKPAEDIEMAGEKEKTLRVQARWAVTLWGCPRRQLALLTTQWRLAQAHRAWPKETTQKPINPWWLSPGSEVWGLPCLGLHLLKICNLPITDLFLK